MKIILSILVAIFFFYDVTAQATPLNCRLPDFPVQDQDGLGTCASNSASLLLQNSMKQPRSPSYIQMSIGISGRSQHSSLGYFQRNGNLFNYGSWICDSYNNALKHGFCDAEAFSLDQVGGYDPLWYQAEVLERLGRLLQNRNQEFKDFIRTFQNPATRSGAQRELSRRLFERDRMCSGNDGQFMAQRFAERYRTELIRIRDEAPDPVTKENTAKLISASFSEAGVPNPELLQGINRNFFMNENLQALNKDAEDRRAASLVGDSVRNNVVGFPLIDIFHSTRARALGITPDPGAYVSTDWDALRRDWQERSPCRGPPLLHVLSRMFNRQSCEVEGVIPREFETNAREIAATLQTLDTQDFNPQVAIIDLISPSCAEQMRKRAKLTGSSDLNCSDIDLTDSASKTRAATALGEKLCQNKPVGVSICTQFFMEPAPVDTQFCRVTGPGVQGHSFHAVTAVGVRTEADGSRKILIQNSWGRSCPFVDNAGVAKPGMSGSTECERDASGLTGRFWVEENLLLNNSIKISVI